MNVCSDPFTGFGEIELDTDDRPTWPRPGSALLVVEDRCEPLFTSATWTIIATVGSMEISRSTQASKAHSPAFIKRWARQLIRSRMTQLRQLGVDVEQTYLGLGGLLEDLEAP